MGEEKRPAYDIRHDTADAYAWLSQFEKPMVLGSRDWVTLEMVAPLGLALLRALDELRELRAELTALRAQLPGSTAEPGAAADGGGM